MLWGWPSSQRYKGTHKGYKPYKHKPISPIRPIRPIGPIRPISPTSPINPHPHKPKGLPHNHVRQAFSLFLIIYSFQNSISFMP